MFWNRSHKDIFTEFVESTTGEVFAKSTMPIDQIPETFEIDTTLEIGTDKFTVVDAIPRKKVDFAKTGKLRVFLKKVETVSLDDLLYSLPTIENSYFAGSSTSSPGHFLKIHADDWRQREFVSTTFSAEIAEELSSIQNIIEQEMKGDFFKTLHVRSKIASPLSDRNLSIDDGFDSFGFKSNYDGFEDDHGVQAESSFAFNTKAETAVFGTFGANHIVSTLCLQAYGSDTGNIEEFCRKHKLIFVDWIRRVTIQ